MTDTSIYRFCPHCQSLLKPIMEEYVIFECKRCMYKTDPQTNIFLSIHHPHRNSEKLSLLQKRSHIFPYDPCLARYRTIPCPNPDCRSHQDDVKPEVVCFSHFSHSMEFMYVCCHCKTRWSPSSS